VRRHDQPDRLAYHHVADHREEGKAACWKSHRRSSQVEVDTEEHAIVEHGRHDKGIVVTDVKDSHTSAATLRGVGMEVGCIQDDCRVIEKVDHNCCCCCCCCTLGGIRCHVNTSPVRFPRCEALREDLFPCSENETWSGPSHLV